MEGGRLLFAEIKFKCCSKPTISLGLPFELQDHSVKIGLFWLEVTAFAILIELAMFNPWTTLAILLSFCFFFAFLCLFFFLSFCLDTTLFSLSFRSSKFNILLPSFSLAGFKVSIASSFGPKESFISQLAVTTAKPSQAWMIWQKSPSIIFDLWLASH